MLCTKIQLSGISSFLACPVFLIKVAWKIVTDGDHGIEMRKVEEGALQGVPKEISGLTHSDAATEAARKAILQNVISSCETTISEE